MGSDAKGHWENDARCLAAACIFDFVISRPESDLAGFVSGKKKITWNLDSCFVWKVHQGSHTRGWGLDGKEIRERLEPGKA